MTDNDRIKELLNSEDPDKQETGLMVLLHEGKKTNYIDELKKCVNSSDDKVRLAANMVMGKIFRRSLIPYLENGLKDKIERIRMNSAISLARYKNEKAIPVLKDILKNDISDHSLHKRAIEALSKYKNEDFLDLFEQMLQHRRIVSRIRIFCSLKRFPP